MPEQRHIREEAATRTAYGLIGVDRPLCELIRPQEGVSWCGVNTRTGNDAVFFQDADHALIHLRYNASIGPCRACLHAIADVIGKEFGR